METLSPNISDTTIISEDSLESEMNDLVDKLISEREANKHKLKFFTDGLFEKDELEDDFEVKFDTGDTVERDEPEIIYF